MIWWPLLVLVPLIAADTFVVAWIDSLPEEGETWPS